MKHGDFTIRRIAITDRGYQWHTYQLTGYLAGKRIRRRFPSLEEALGDKNRLEVQAANGGGEIRAINTRLSLDQIAEAESAIKRLGIHSLTLVVDWFLSTYKPPSPEIALEVAAASFLAEKTLHVRPVALRDYRNSFASFFSVMPGRSVQSVKTEEVHRFLTARKVGKKRWNNLRGDLHALFNYCQSAPREWISKNPVKAIPVFAIARSLPEIITAQTAADLMAYVEKHDGSQRSNLPPGCLAPYFALCLFAGLRPSIPDGEVCKIGWAPNVSKLIDLGLGVIRITPDLAKTKSIRQVSIQPNLAKWLTRFPLERFPIIPSNIRRMVQPIRKKFALTNDVLRHTFISMHVAKFKSLGAAALEAGNSECIVRRHYLNLVSEADAQKFWSVLPTTPAMFAPSVGPTVDGVLSNK